jgi:LL-diaminopimelate aminotransferase
MKRNRFFTQLSSLYLFSEIKARVSQFQEKHHEVRLISLGLGDTTEPLGSSTADAISHAAADMKDADRYTGYGPDQGLCSLREKICSVIYHNTLSPDEVFISDGAKGDIARLLVLFGPHAHIISQDPSYPAYADAARLSRSSDSLCFSYLPCLPDSCPSLTSAPDGAVIFLCSPNNPTGEVFTHTDLTTLVNHARHHRQLIVFDTAYQAFIQGDLPKSIYEVDGAKEVAIEIGSFSKMAGFSGVRLGWTVVPHALRYQDGQSIHHDFQRIITTFFNGASILSQKGGIQVLSPEGQKESAQQIEVYRKNTLLLQKTFLKKDFPVCGGLHAPYIWVKTVQKNSWEAFDYFLHKAGIIVTPGIGFGPSGEGYIRICGFGKPSAITEAASRISLL